MVVLFSEVSSEFSAERIVLMAIPNEFTFANEDEFVQRFIIPLLHRLGFSIVVNYHRTHGELGKDLVFAEIDRFGNIRYCGLQAKYEPSIGLSAVESLIQDCRQAFNNPFMHPHKHTEERIQSFYVLNGGSISSNASEHFFNSVGYPLATCCCLLDGKSLLVIDRWAAANRSLTTLPDLNGLLLEVEYNRRIQDKLGPVLEQIMQALQSSEGIKSSFYPVFPYRFRLNASARYLFRPFMVEAIPVEKVECYWDLLNLCNDALESCFIGFINMPPTTAPVVKANSQKLIEFLPNISKLGNELAVKIKDILQTLDPLAAA
jgi:hypothetical protein